MEPRRYVGRQVNDDNGLLTVINLMGTAIVPQQVLGSSVSTLHVWDEYSIKPPLAFNSGIAPDPSTGRSSS